MVLLTVTTRIQMSQYVRPCHDQDESGEVTTIQIGQKKVHM